MLGKPDPVARRRSVGSCVKARHARAAGTSCSPSAPVGERPGEGLSPADESVSPTVSAARSLRIAVVGPLHPFRGGIALHGAEMAAAADRAGHDVRVLSYARLYPGFLFPGRTQLDPDSAPAAVRSIEQRALLDSCTPWRWPRAARWLTAWRPDVVVLQRWHPFFAPALATVARALRRRGALIVWMVHNALPHEGSRWLWRPLARLGYAAGDVCLTHAQSELHELRALGIPSHVRHVPHPAPAATTTARAAVDESRAALGIAEGEALFVFVGYVREYKGVDVLLDALVRLDAEGPSWRAIIAGEWYVDRTAADRLVSQPPLAGRVRIDDRYLPGEDVARVLAAATVVVLPYRSGTQSGVVPLAYAHGRGVITTRVGGLAEAVREGETGLLVPPGDPVALADALERVRRGFRFSPAAIDAMRDRARWSAFVDVLEELADEHSRSSRP
ncbi:glycosyltransferase [Candidatus Binatia bacterium]|nr:glycosyltransferase [Candidatus Binatia bacterium]